MNISVGRINTSRFLSKISLNKVELILDARKFTKPSRKIPQKDGEVLVSAASVRLKNYRNVKEYIEHMRNFVAQAVEKNCNIVVFPQYSGLLPLTMLSGIEEIVYSLIDLYNDDNKTAAIEFSELFDTFGNAIFNCYYNVFSLLALKYGIYIHAGSTIVPTKQGIYNQSMIFDPNGNNICPQNKIFGSDIEANFNVCAGDSIESYEFPFGNISTIIGEDQYRFETFKAARNLGSKIIVVPDGPESDYNEYKEFRGAPMRVQESNCAAIRSMLVGDFAGFNFRGKSGIYVPYNYDDVENGVIACTSSDCEDELVCAKIDTNKLIAIKELYASDVNAEFYRKIWGKYIEK